MMVNRPAEIRPMRSPKLRRPTARPPRMTVKLSHERKVRSFAKKTLGSTRVGRAMRLPAVGGVSQVNSSAGTFPKQFLGRLTWGRLEEWLA
jgi:hypothetical protein